MFVETRDGTRLYYNDWGDGPPMVLIHGWPLSSAMWEYQAPLLAENGQRVIAYDRRGFGRSDQPWKGYDYDTLADDLADLLEHLDLRGVTLVGFSMGGGEVARYLSRHGTDRIARAVLVSAVTPFLLKTDDNPDGVDRRVFEDMLANLREDRPAFLSSFGNKFFGTSMLDFSVSTELMDWAQMLALQASPAATLACVHAFAETDFRPDMASFTVPTLVIHGGSDETVPISHSGRIAARMIPNAQLIVYAGGPHAVFINQKDRLVDDLLAFAGARPRLLRA